MRELKSTDRAAILDKTDKLISRVEKLIPKVPEPDLPPIKLNPYIPDWHAFEHEIWRLGDDLRLLIKENQALKRDDKLFQQILRICTNRNAKRGRQSFIMLLGSKQFSRFAANLITQLDDEFVEGYVIATIQKMHAAGFESEIKPFTEHKHAWIRNAAKKYLTQKNGIILPL